MYGSRRWPAVEVDSIDLRILMALETDGRIRKSELAMQVGLSASACLERMRKLEKKRLILNYHAEINVRLLSHVDFFFTELKLFRHRAHDFEKFERCVRANKKIIECFGLAGGIDYIIKVVSKSATEYQVIIDDLLVSEVGVEKYLSYVVTKVVKSSNYTPISSLDFVSE
ncbi:Lrp/AsnC family transcriptional regulator [Ensifer sp. BR816]|uniref:Lrp/AsnC family transcriptional regulator n=1 Tax=Rhizobium sp. (strain BR816) TaxID=1057002 RepID=UPI0003619761|nr:Lrp/AsnC family transcriptional regulator [Ensifer sp. BR816]